MSNLLDVRELKVDFTIHGEEVRTVDGVSFRIRAGGTTALVGESGSGKSVCSQAIMGILPNIGTIAGGQILFTDPDGDGTPVDLAQLPRDSARMRSIRGGRISMIFQEPMISLSPLHTVGDQICEALHLHRDVDKPTGRELATDMLRLVGFPEPPRAMKTYPFELSGGLRQRAMIAMALVCRPALLIADEPTTALDVTIQAQILKLIKDLQSELNMAVLMITHDLGVVANVAEEVVVMFRGHVMETGSVEDIFTKPEHPYLKALLNAVPRFDLAEGERLVPLREVKAEAGNMLKPELGQARGEKGAPLLKVEHLSKEFEIRKGSFFGSRESRKVLAVDDVSFTVPQGSIYGFL
ncbi:MAG: ATP-binding cassette domain-containing protein, partial [Alphaproteobacteria bacterium]